jgi:hypothetical protein
MERGGRSRESSASQGCWGSDTQTPPPTSPPHRHSPKLTFHAQIKRLDGEPHRPKGVNHLLRALEEREMHFGERKLELGARELEWTTSGTGAHA